MILDEKADPKGVVKAVYINPLDLWRNRVMGFLYVARVSRHVLAIPRYAGPV